MLFIAVIRTDEQVSNIIVIIKKIKSVSLFFLLMRVSLYDPFSPDERWFCSLICVNMSSVKWTNNYPLQ